MRDGFLTKVTARVCASRPASYSPVTENEVVSTYTWRGDPEALTRLPRDAGKQRCGVRGLELVQGPS